MNIFETIISQLQNWMQNSPSNRTTKPDKKIILLATIVVLLGWLSSGIRKINLEQLGVVLRFGKVDRILEPGLRYTLPYPIETIKVVDATSIRRIDADATALTGDENIALVHFYVLWNIKNPADYLFSAKTPDDTVKAAADSIMREIIALNNFDKILTVSRSDIIKQAHQELQAFVDKCKLGIEIIEIQLGTVDPPNVKVSIIEEGEEKQESVVEAYREVQKAKADFERSINEAESYENYIIPESRGKAEKIIQAANAYKINKLAAAEGEAAQFSKLEAAHNQAPELVKSRLTNEYKKHVLKQSQQVLFGDINNTSPLINLSNLPIKLIK